METLLLRDDAASVAAAAKILRAGGLVAIPTETVYGLAASALDGAAVEAIFRAKGRPQDNPLIVHISHPDQLAALVTEIPASARALSERFWPGPLTMILPRSDRVAPQVSAGLSTVAVRLPSHPLARAIIDAAGVPLAAPSANTSGRPSPTRAEHVLEDLGGRIDAIVDGGECAVGVESTVVSLAGDTPALLRPGGITPEQLREVLGEVKIDRAVTQMLEKDAVVASPGMKYKHYAPKARVSLVRGTTAQFAEFVNERQGDGVAALCFEEDLPSLSGCCICYGGMNSGEEQARRLFDALRRMDELGIRRAYAHCPDSDGVGLAVYNRLLRAAAFEVIEL